MRIPVLFALLLSLFAHRPARADPGDRGSRAPEEPWVLPETVVTPSRRESPLFFLPVSTSVLEGEELGGARAPRSLPDAAEEIPGVMVQKTGYGQGSPYLRGLTGFRTLTLIDGIRLNHSAYRSGPNQYFATIDHLSLARLEVVRGPGSVLYGSDAMGGVLNVIPRRPVRKDGEYPLGGRVLTRLAAAERSAVERLEITGGLGAELGFLAGVDRKRFGDLRAGDGRLPGTGYDEWDGDAVVSWSAAPGLEILLGWQRVSQDDVPRTHKTLSSRPWHGTERGSERRRTLDQLRDLVYLEARAEKPADFLDSLRATLSWQRQRESRYRVQGAGRSDRQGFTVDAYGISLTALSDTDVGLLTWGLDGTFERVGSFRVKYDAGGRVTSVGIQGPVADDAAYDLLGVFARDEVDLGSGFTFSAGARATRARVDADRVEDPRTGRRISLSDTFGAVVGAARLSYTGLRGWNLYAGAAQGFRAPNLSDLTRFDTARSNEIETPSPGLDPERSLTFEAGVKGDLDPVRFELSLYHTVLRDLIRRFPTGREIDGDVEVTKDNVGDGYVRGVELRGEIDLGGGFVAFGGGSFTQGRADTYPTSRRRKAREYLDRLPPLSGQVGIRGTPGEGLFVSARLRMADKADRLSSRDRADTQRIPPGGTPGHAVIDLTGSLDLSDRATLTLSVENLTDRAFRIHGSGQNEPGRNLVLTLEIRF